MSTPADRINYGHQAALEGLGPQPGDTYRNIHTGRLGTIVSVGRNRRTWYMVRHNGSETMVSDDWLGQHWVACRPDGTPR